MLWLSIPGRRLRRCAALALLVPGLAAAALSAPAGPVADALQGSGRVHTPISLFSDVSVYRRGGLFEIYGATLSETKTGPVEIAATVLRYDEGAPAAAAIWRPALPLRTEAPGVAVVFGDADQAANAAFLVKTCTASGFTVFTAGGIGPAALAEPLGQLRLRKDWQPWLDAAGTPPATSVPVGQGWRIDAALGPGPHCIEALGLVHLRGPDDERVEVAFAGLTAPARPGYMLEGQIEGRAFYEVHIGLTFADGSRLRIVPDDSGAFTVPGLDPAVPVSLEAHFRGEIFAPTLGRWFSGVATSPVTIPVGRMPADIREKIDPDTNIFPPLRRPSQVAAIFPPHAPMLYGGYGGVKEFHTALFTNNHGYHDQDRTAANPNSCFRIFVAGSSTTEAIQAPVSEHFATVAEERLGLALGRCVEVISASTSNGDPGASFEHFMKYGRSFAPDLVLFEVAPELLLQMNDTYAWDYLGWSLEEPVKGRFIRGKDGGYTYRDRSNRWVSFLNPDPSRTGLPEGYVPQDFYFFDFTGLPPEMAAVFDTLDHIAAEVAQAGPEGMRFGFFSVIHQLGCRGACKAWEAETPEGAVPAGHEIWFREFAGECGRRGWACLIPPAPPGFDRPGAHLSFDYDAHPSSAGHQWIAQQIADWVLQNAGRRP